MWVPTASVPAVTSTTVRRTARAGFRCSECGWTSVRWVGRCGECQAWGTVGEEGGGHAGPRTTATAPTRSPARPIDEVDQHAATARPTGVDELDRVLGGGLVPGAVVLLAGEPGVGKSTLLLDVAARTARAGRRVLYVTGEESAAQIRLRADRIRALDPGLLLADETDLGTVLGHIEATDPRLLVVDSVQTIASAQVEGPAGGVTQVREVAAALIAAAKSRDLPVLLVGHVTKTARSPARAPWSTWSTSCASSRASTARGCACCARRRTGTARRTRSAASTCPSTASSGWPTRAACSSPRPCSKSPAPA